MGPRPTWAWRAASPRCPRGDRPTPEALRAVHLAAGRPLGFARHRTVLKDCSMSGLIPLKGATQVDRRSRIHRAPDSAAPVLSWAGGSIDTWEIGRAHV